MSKKSLILPNINFSGTQCLFLSLLISVPKLIGTIVGLRLKISSYVIHFLTSVPNNVISLALFMRDHRELRFQQLIDLVCSDYPNRLNRFTLMYELLSIKWNRRIKILVYGHILFGSVTVAQVFESARWSEREIWDMFGVFFRGHLDLRRILTDYGFNGHPFRKDFPLIGFLELQYHEINKTLKYDIVEQSAEFRLFKWRKKWSKTYLKNFEYDIRDIELTKSIIKDLVYNNDLNVQILQPVFKLVAKPRINDVQTIIKKI